MCVSSKKACINSVSQRERFSSMFALLSSLHMAQYEEAFRRERIDLEVARGLSDEDLKNLGLALGDRRRLLKALSPEPSPVASLGTPKPPPAAAVPERPV